MVRVGRIFVVPKDFYFSIELVTTESSAAHNRVGRAKASAYDNVVSCCVAIEEVMRVRQTRPDTYDKHARQRYASDKGILCDREFYIARDLNNNEKKPRDLERHINNSIHCIKSEKLKKKRTIML